MTKEFITTDTAEEQEIDLTTQWGRAVHKWRTRLKNAANLGEQPQSAIVLNRKQSAAGATTKSAWCSYPTDMTRLSPFFPMNVNQIGEQRPFLRNVVITSGGWGEMTYSGPKLSIYEEDCLIALLAMIDDKHQREEIIVEDKPTYKYSGSVLPLLKLLGYTRPGKDAYDHLISSLSLLMSSVIIMKLSGGTSKNGKKNDIRYIHMLNLLSSVKWDDKKKELQAVVNPYFYEMYYNKRVTLLNVQKRMEIRGLISKALYRFVQSHRKNIGLFVGNFLTLANAINMDTTQQKYKIRQLLKKAILELIKKNILTPQSGFIDRDIVRLDRAMDTLPAKQVSIH